MLDLPKNERVPVTSAVSIIRLQQTCDLSLARGVFRPRRSPVRRCVACGARVTNRNLGGNNGRSALSGPLWCLQCADRPQQLLLTATSKQSDRSCNHVGDEKNQRRASGDSSASKWMLAMKPPNEKGALLRAHIPRLPMRTVYRALQLLQAAFGFVFWKI